MSESRMIEWGQKIKGVVKRQRRGKHDRDKSESRVSHLPAQCLIWRIEVGRDPSLSPQANFRHDNISSTKSLMPDSIDSFDHLIMQTGVQ